MQPNEQDPNKQSYGPPAQPPVDPPVPSEPLPYQVPEYLKLEPIADPAVTVNKKRKRRLMFLAVGITLAVLIIGGVVMNWYAQWSSPQAKFHRALDKQLQVSYMSRVYSVKDSVYDIASTYKVDSNFSDPSHPQSHKIYTESGVVKSMLSSSKPTTYTIGTEQTMIDNTNLYYRYTDVTTQNALPFATKKDQWYSYNLRAANQGEAEYSLSGLDDLQYLNSPQGVIVTGNFSDSQRSQLLDFIEQNDVYQIVSSESDKLNDLSTVQYVIKIDRTKINNLNTKAKELLRTSHTFKLSSVQPASETLRLWVDSKTDQFVKMTYSVSKSNNNIQYEKDIMMSYPSNVSVKKPINIKNDDR